MPPLDSPLFADAVAGLPPPAKKRFYQRNPEDIDMDSLFPVDSVDAQARVLFFRDMRIQLKRFGAVGELLEVIKYELSHRNQKRGLILPAFCLERLRSDCRAMAH
jgi:hypothetical protein